MNELHGGENELRERCTFLALQYDFQICHIHIWGVLLAGKHAFGGTPILCLEKGIVFAIGHREERSDAC